MPNLQHQYAFHSLSEHLSHLLNHEIKNVSTKKIHSLIALVSLATLNKISCDVQPTIFGSQKKVAVKRLMELVSEINLAFCPTNRENGITQLSDDGEKPWVLTWISSPDQNVN